MAVSPFAKVQTAEEWSRLLRYYAECLTTENRQQYIIELNGRPRLHFEKPRGVEAALAFMDGSQTLRVDTGTALHRFIREGPRDREPCLAYPVIFLRKGDSRRLAPVFVARLVEEDGGGGGPVLRAVECEPSYALLKELGQTEEEIAALIAELDAMRPSDDKSLLQAQGQRLLERLREITGSTLSGTSWVPGSPDPDPTSYSLLTTPCFFWVTPGVYTRSLIQELRDLARPDHWGRTPTHLKQLLSEVPEHDYPAAPPRALDDEVYVTPVNDEQRRTFAAAQDPLTVVTGPPGTGKSQLILNLLIAAALRGERALFASRNNKAVDVVMDRLSQEIRFPGAVRTGNQEARERVPDSMEKALDDALRHPFSASALDRVKATRRSINKELLGAVEERARVRNLEGLAKSYEQEIAAITRVLGPDLAKLASEHRPDVSAREYDALAEIVSDLRARAIALVNRLSELSDQFRALVEDNRSQLAVLSTLYDFERRWGWEFGRGVLHPRQESLSGLREATKTWMELLLALEKVAERSDLERQRRQQETDLAGSRAVLPERLGADASRLAMSLEPAVLRDVIYRAESVLARAQKQLRPRGVWARVLTRLRLRSPSLQAARSLAELQARLGVKQPLPERPLRSDLPALVERCQEVAQLVKVALEERSLAETCRLLEAKETEVAEAVGLLDPLLRDDVTRVEVRPGEANALMVEMRGFLSQLDALETEKDRLDSDVQTRLRSRPAVAAFIEQVSKATDAFVPPDHGADTQGLLGQLRAWSDTVALWSQQAGLARIRSDAATLPGVAQLEGKVTELQGELAKASAELARESWREGVRSLPDETVRRTRLYVSALRRLNGPGARSTASDMASVAENLPYALQAFPIWATTSLAAKTNIPLSPEVFDLLVIDEAAQSDIASALPLLYRAKRAVIVGDPRQLRHVASITSKGDEEAGEKFGISLDAFSYREISLFDLAYRNAGRAPGAIFLADHYRSHPRIIRFPNLEFYGGALRIRTDPARLVLQEERCGVHWLHVEGEMEYAGGSAFNRAEVLKIGELVDRILAELPRIGAPGASMGVVTPYRRQREETARRLDRVGQRCHVNTAHGFQGDEKDIIIFSPVVSSGFTPGSLFWLDRTQNLFNVAITRARSAIIVVGDWDYCVEKLPKDNKLRRLAEHVREWGVLVRNIEELPLLGGNGFEPGLLDRFDRDYNRQTLRRLLLYCRQFVWWVDPYFYDHIFDLLDDVSQDASWQVRSVKLLTSVEQTRSFAGGGQPQLRLEKARTFQASLGRRGISMELGLLLKKELPHDRLLYSANYRLNMPPFMGAYGDHKMISEYTETTTDPSFFEEFWSVSERV